MAHIILRRFPSKTICYECQHQRVQTDAFRLGALCQFGVDGFGQACHKFAGYFGHGVRAVKRFGNFFASIFARRSPSLERILTVYNRALATQPKRAV